MTASESWVCSSGVPSLRRARYVVGCQGPVGGLAETGDCTQRGVRQHPGADLVVTDADVRSNTESLPGPPCGLAGAAETASKAMADGCVGRCVRGLAEHGTWKTSGGVPGNVLVERKVTATASSTRGKQA